ncbi:dynein light chain roadblock-type 2 isoform X1 [Puntigrus tetrazona]|uniref:dynein light chain roadblock-type 2 isoform X1 n=1 Tax=Puntigrus tetrazona TaxID=1606681 RepID=UPI001C893DA0|nr:dynein light chain roadblock-type 2 isoform X1 [Puntigrus tetrazona]
MAEVEDTLKRIQGISGVIGTIVVNAEGIPIRTTLDNSATVQYAGLLHQLTLKARSTVRDIDPQNELTFLRIRSKKHEIMVSTALCEQPALSAMTFCESLSLWRVSVIVFWTIAKSEVFPVIVVSKNKRYLELILWGWSFNETHINIIIF